MNASANSAAPNATPVNSNGFDPTQGRGGWYGDVQQIQKEVLDSAGWVSPLQTEMARVIVGQRYLVDRLSLAS